MAPASTGGGIYTVNGLANELRQGELISNVAQYIFRAEDNAVVEISHSRVIVLGQDCDLLRDHDQWIQDGSNILDGVLLFPIGNAEDVRHSDKLTGDLWKRTRQNVHERYHFLSPVPKELDLSGIGLAPQIIDFRRHFTLHPSELLTQIASGSAVRHCRLLEPYREHVQHRMAHYISRVGLPMPHGE